MTTNIRDRIEEFSNAQLDAVIEVLEPFDIEEWDEDSAEYGPVMIGRMWGTRSS